MNLCLIFCVVTIANRISAFDTNGTVCIDFQQFQSYSIDMNGHYQLKGEIGACPERKVCQNVDGSAECVDNKLRSIEAVDPPLCSGPGNHPAFSCYQYYRCIQQLLFFWVPQLETCPENQAFDKNLKNCVPSENAECYVTTTTTTTTTLAPPIEPEQCTAPRKQPALICFQYFECVRALFSWKLELKTCPAGQAYDKESEKCVCAGLVNCELPGGSLKCEVVGKQTALNCSQYYQCEQKLWWLQPKLKSCPSGQLYDQSICDCAPSENVECRTECNGYATYPGTSNKEYFECTLDDSGMKWELQKKTCGFGFIYLAKFNGCAPTIFQFL